MSWPHVISRDQRVLYTLVQGHMYKIVPQDDTIQHVKNNSYTLFKDQEVVADVAVEGRIVDFMVNHEVVVLATVNPAGLHICKPFKGTVVLHLYLPLDPKDSNVIENITLGNYGGNIIALWYGPTSAPVYVGMISGKDAFRFDPMPLVYYDEYGRQQMYIRPETESIMAVPYFPNQFGAIATISPVGLKFYGLHPFYMMTSLHDDAIVHLPFTHSDGWISPNPKDLPNRFQFSGYDLLVHIRGNHLTMKYDPLEEATWKKQKDWIRVFLDGQEIAPNQFIYVTPTDVESLLQLEPRVNATDVVLHADLPVSFKLSNQVDVTSALSQTGLKYLPKGIRNNLFMKTIQAITPWQLSRFIEKFNLKIRAELWG